MSEKEHFDGLHFTLSVLLLVAALTLIATAANCGYFHGAYIAHMDTHKPVEDRR